MKNEELRNFISVVTEKRLREMEVVELASGEKTDFGSSEHITDLEKCIADMTRIRNRHKKGSAARDNYSRAISRLKVELSKAQKLVEINPQEQ